MSRAKAVEPFSVSKFGIGSHEAGGLMNETATHEEGRGDRREFIFDERKGNGFEPNRTDSSFAKSGFLFRVRTRVCSEFTAWRPFTQIHKYAMCMRSRKNLLLAE